MFFDYFGLNFTDYHNCSWADRALGQCPAYDDFEDFIDQWVEGQKDKICGGETCESIVQRCSTMIATVTRSTGQILICHDVVANQCNKIKEKCKECLPETKN